MNSRGTPELSCRRRPPCKEKLHHLIVGRKFVVCSPPLPGTGQAAMALQGIESYRRLTGERSIGRAITYDILAISSVGC